MECLICNYRDDDKKRFSFHVNSHDMSTRQYTTRYVLGLSSDPICSIVGCGNEVRYVSFSFKKYCRDHSRKAESEGGKIGGQIKKTWNKGLTRAIDDRIRSMVGVDNPFFGKKHTEETRSRISASKTLLSSTVVERVLSNCHLKLACDPQTYISRQHQYLHVKCVECGAESDKTLQSIERGSRCYRCYPMTSSLSEIEIGDIIESYGIDIRRNCRDMIPPKEIDIYVPSKNFAIEFNGLYWHSRKEGSPTKHLEKTSRCAESGVRLMHIFSDEWRDKRDICLSMISHRLGITERRVSARDCVVSEIGGDVASAFFESSHISGNVNSSVRFGLYYDDELVAAMSLRRPFHRASYPDCVEIARFCTSRSTNVVGGLGKLLRRAKDWSSRNGYSKLITYVDRRFGEGSGYLAAGMKFVKDTGINYWYTDGVRRFDRFKFRSRDGMSENDVASAANVQKIYGCGNRLFMLDISK